MNDMVHNEMSGWAQTVIQAGTLSATFVVPPKRPSARRQDMAPPSANFINRTEQIALIREECERCRTTPGHTPPVIVVRGLPGVGKTALLRKIVAIIGASFAGGVLFVDFAGLLLAIGADESWIPVDFDQRVALWRTMTADRRLLLVLDNVTDEAEVAPLMPNSGTSMVLVGGVRIIEGLVLDGAIDVELEVLSPADSLELLAKTCPDGRVEREPEAARTLVELCGRLPLAIGVIGANLATRRAFTVSQAVEELTDQAKTLDRLSVGGRIGVRAAFDVVYRDLPATAALVYRSVGLLVGSHFEVDVVAAMCALSKADAADALESLRQFGLVDERPDGTFALHRLLRLHALGESEQHDSGEDRTARLRGAVRWWRFAAAAADVAVTGRDRLRITDYRIVLGDAIVELPSRAGLAWLDREHANILGLMRACADRGWHDEIWPLFEALFALYDHRRPLASWIESGELAVTAAQATGNLRAEARVRCLLAKGCQEKKNYGDAHKHLDIARDLAARSGDTWLIASTMDFTGNVQLRQGEHAAALASFEQSLALHEELDPPRPRGVAMQSMMVGRALGKLGRVDEAVVALERARGLATTINDTALLAKILLSSGRVFLDADRDAESTAVLHEALAIARSEARAAVEADTVLLLARLARRGRNAALADEYFQQATDAYQKMGSPEAASAYAEWVRARDAA
jgi:tetratricopeptide (TPR) repeat protein